MPIVYTHFVAYDRKGGRRLHPGTATVEIHPMLRTDTPDGGIYQVWAPPSPPWTDPQGHTSANFLFWSVVGASDGASVTTSQSLSITVDGSDVQAVAWYLPTGGPGGNGGPAVYIDAFDVDQGRFFDEDFVTVTPDAALSANANETGVVPTTSAEDITAVTSIESVPFLDWTEFVQPAPRIINNQDLHADANSTAVAFAFYYTPVNIFRPTGPQLGTWVSWGVKVDAGGLTGHGPVPPWTGPALRQLAAGLALADAAALVAAELQGAVKKLAADQVALASRQIADQIAGQERPKE